MNATRNHLVILVWSLLVLCARPLGGAQVTAAYSDAAVVPVTAAAYTATGNSVEFTLSFTPPVGTNLTVVEVTGPGIIEGRFDNLAHGQHVALSHGGIRYGFVADYYGGTGNDLVLQWADTRILAWGRNSSGQLGLGHTSGVRLPTPVTASVVLAGKTIIEAVAGGNCSLVLCADGTIAAWGNNSYGQLGDGTRNVRSVPVEVDRSGVLSGKTVVTLAAGEQHTLALCADGTLAAWGSNDAGQLGDGQSTSYSLVPVLVDRSGVLAGKTVTAIAAGGRHSLALCADGTLAFWGQAGPFDPGSSTRVPVEVPHDGALTGKTVVKIAAGSSHSLVLCADGTLAAWGFNEYGQLGNNSMSFEFTSVPVAVNQNGVLWRKTVTGIWAGDQFSLALCSDGTLASWGFNMLGQLGDGTSNYMRMVPVVVVRTGVLRDKTVVDLRGGASHALALCSDGTLAAWGANGGGQLGIDSTLDSGAPVLVDPGSRLPDERVVVASTGVGATHNLVLVASPPGPVVTTGDATGIANATATLNGTVSANGQAAEVYFEYGLTANYGQTVTAGPAQVTGTVDTAVTGALSGLLSSTTYHYRLVATTGTATSYGEDRSFTTGAFATLASLTPDTGTLVPGFDSLVTSYQLTVPFSASTMTMAAVPVDPRSAVRVAVGGGDLPVPGDPIALDPGSNRIDVTVTSPDGSITQVYRVTVTRLPQVFTYASAAAAPLAADLSVFPGGTADFVLNFAPVAGTSLKVLENTSVSVIGGRFDNLAQGQEVLLEHAGVRYSFVANYHGGTTGNDLVLEWANTRLFAWGLNSFGQLGLGFVPKTRYTNPGSVPPTPGPGTGALAGKRVLRVETGGIHAIALCADGSLASWGTEEDSLRLERSVPAVVEQGGILHGRSVTDVMAGRDGYLALCADGTLAQWGIARDARPPRRSEPTGALVGKTVVAIDAGSLHTLALCADGTMVAWGYGSGGVLGNGSTSNSGPVEVDHTGVLNGKKVVRIVAGYNHNLALCSDNTLVAWGSNEDGAVGDNTTTSRSVPVLVNRGGVLASKTIVDIAAGEAFSLALCSDGTLAAWGTDDRGRLGNPASNMRSLVPVAVPQTGVLASRKIVGVAAGYRHVLAVCSDGALVGWGDNENGQLGVSGIWGGHDPFLIQPDDLRPGERFVEAYTGVQSQFSFGLAAAPPAAIVATETATDVSDLTARLHARVSANGSTSTVRFEFGLTDDYGESIAASPAQVTGTTPVSASALLGNLRSGTTYHYRVVAESAGGLSYGEDRTFTTTRTTELASLTADAGTLVPAFKSYHLDYTIMVPFTTTSITLTPAPFDPAVTIRVAGGGGLVPVGTPVSLDPGDNQIAILVTSADGSVNRVYRVAVTRLPETFRFSSPSGIPLTAGRVSLDGEIPALALEFAPTPGTALTLIENTGTEPIHGRFGNLPHGQLVELEYQGVSYPFAVNYFGGEGFNDLVLHWGNVRIHGWGHYGVLGVGNNPPTLHPVEVEHAGGLAGRTVIALEAGSAGPAAVCADGTLHTWGAGPPVIVNAAGVLADRQVVAVAIGGEHFLALCADGGVVGWGNNNMGQLGNGTTKNAGRSSPVEVDRSGVLANKSVIAIAAGYSHSLAICGDGTLVAWGENRYGQLGNGDTVDRSVPVAVDRSGVLAGKTVVAIAAGNFHSMALCTDGTLAVWGRGTHGALGVNTTENKTTPVRADTMGVLAGRKVKRIAAGALHSLALCTDGTLAAWGDASHGKLGNGSSSSDSLVPVRVDQTGALLRKTVTEITAGDAHNHVALSDGRVASWGSNEFGQLGDGTTVRRSTPVLVDGSFPGAGRRMVAGSLKAQQGSSLALVASPPACQAETLEVSDVHDYRVTLDGLVNANGSATAIRFEYGPTAKLGLSLPAVPGAVSGTADTPVTADLTGLVPGETYFYRISAQSVGGLVQGETLSFTTSGVANLADLTTSVGILVPGFDPFTTRYAVTVPAGTTRISVTPLAATPGATITVSGSAVASGAESPPVNLATGNTAIPVVVAAPDGINVRAYVLTVTRLPESIAWNSAADVPLETEGPVLAGAAPTLSLAFHPEVGTGLTLVNNLGLEPIMGAFDDLAQGERVVLPYQGLYYEFVANYFGGTGNDLVLQWARTKLFGWGVNSLGQLGAPSVDGFTATPTHLNESGPLAGRTIIDTAAGRSHSLFLCSDGTLWASGYNVAGQLGNSSVESYSIVPVPVDRTGVLAGKTVVQVSAGYEHSLALCSDGTVVTWGGGGNGGPIGIGATASAEPKDVAFVGDLAGKRVVAIDAGSFHNLALCSDGAVAAWGANEWGQLGNGLQDPSVNPVPVDISGVLLGKVVTQVSAGATHSLVLCSDGTVAAWGQDYAGSLGTGISEDSPVPVAVDRSGVLAGRTVVQVSAGKAHSVAVCADGAIASWGTGSDCQLGNGECYTYARVPVLANLSKNLAGKKPLTVSASDKFNVTYCVDGTVASWGDRGATLGTGITNRSETTPTPVSVVNLQPGDRMVGAETGHLASVTFSIVAGALQAGATNLDVVVTGDTSATLRGVIRPNGMPVTVEFEFGLDETYGMTASADPGQVSGVGETEVAAQLAGLLPGTTYHYRVVTSSLAGVSYGGDRSFTTTDLASLAGLSLSEGLLSPRFIGTQTEYAAMVPHATTSVTVSPVTTHISATTTVNGTLVASGEVSAAIPLGVGSNTITVEVIPASAGDRVVYRVVVSRFPERFTWSSADQAHLSVGGFAPVGISPFLDLAFTPEVGGSLMLIDNTGLEPILGTFDNLGRGQLVHLEFGGISYPYYVNYTGGTGNDLVLEWGSTRLIGWGSNEEGQLGNGTKNSWDYPYSSPVPVVDTGVLANKAIRQVSVGDVHVLALCWDGSIAAWGNNSSGGLGNGTTTDSTVPVAVDMSGVLVGKEVIDVCAGGGARSYAVCRDGTIVTWGFRDDDPLSLPGITTTHPVPEEMTALGALVGKQVVDIESGGRHDLALCSDGTVAAWGSNDRGQLGDGTWIDSSIPVAINMTGVLRGRSVVRIAAGNNHSLALCADGTVVAWGDNDAGRLGNGSTDYSSVPVAVETDGVLSGRTVVAIAATGSSSGALCSDGAVATWGSNHYGALGDGKGTDWSGSGSSSIPVEIDRSGVLAGKVVTALSGDGSSFRALTADGLVACWGYNRQGQLGDTTTTSSNVPVLTDLSSLGPREALLHGVAPSAGGGSTIAIIGTWPDPVATTLAAESIRDGSAILHGALRPNGRATAFWFEFGRNSSYGTRLDPSPAEHTGGGTQPTSVPVNGLRPGTTYHYRLVASSSDGTVFGEDRSFTTSASATLASLVASEGELLPGFDATRTDYALTVGHFTTSLTLAATPASASASVTANGSPVVPGATSAAIALAVGNTVIPVTVSTEGGANSLTYTVTVTRLPDAIVFQQADEVPVTAAAIRFGGGLSLGLGFAPENGTSLTVARVTGLARSRGAFDHLAHGRTIDLEHGGISYRFVVNYFGGDGNDLVLEWANVRLLGWGDNGSGQLGVGTTESTVGKPTPLAGGSRTLDGKTPVDLAGGSLHSLALHADGTLAAWGGNERGQLGIGSRKPSAAALPVDPTGFLAGRTVVAVDAASSHSLALCSDGTLVGWGDNSWGQLGNTGSLIAESPLVIEEAGCLEGREIARIEAGGGFNLALCTDGTLVSWGSNSAGVLGIGDPDLSFSPVPVSVSEGSLLDGKQLVALAAGGSHALTLDAEGNVHAWGSNDYGQLGDGTRENRSRPVAVSRVGALAGRQVVAIAAGTSHSLALCADGTLVAWGRNNDGQLGVGSTSDSPVPVVVDQTNLLAGKTIVQIAAGSHASFALCADGTVAAWGDNRSARLGLAESANYRVNTPMAVDTSAIGPGERLMALKTPSGHHFAMVAAGPLARVETLAAGEVRDTTAVVQGAVTANGEATDAGFEFGVSREYGQSTPIQAAGSGAGVALSEALSGLIPATTYHYRAIARSASGTAYGPDRTFTTGNAAALAGLALSAGTLSPEFAPDRTSYITTVPATTSSVSLTIETADAGTTVRVDGAPVGPGGISDPVALTEGGNAILIEVTSADGSSSRDYVVEVTRLPAAFTFHSATDVAITANRFLADGNAPVLSLGYLPVPGTALRVVDRTGSGSIEGVFANLVQGERLNLAHGGVTYPFVVNYFGGDGNDLVLEWATKRLIAWGYNYAGQLGDDTQTNRLTPVRVGADGVLADGVLAGKLVLSAVGSNNAHSLALLVDGTVAAWGENNRGQLGVGTTDDSWVPRLVDRTGVLAGKHVIRIAAGGDHNLALCADGSLVAWGENKYGQLGIGRTGDFEDLPVRVDSTGVLAGKRVTDIAAGSDTSYAVCSDGTIAAWGRNTSGQLGDGSKADRNRPVLVVRTGDLANQLVRDLAAGAKHCIALLADGRLVAWGDNGAGQLGIGSTIDQSVPVEVDATGILDGKTVVAVAAGDSQSLALCADNTLAGWGGNYRGNLGNDSTASSPVPIETGLHGVLVGKSIVSIDTAVSSMAVCADGSVATWGYGNSGRLGNGSSDDSLVPVAVDLSDLRVGERVVAASSGGASVIAQVASPPPAGAMTLAAIDIRDTSAVLQGQVTPNGSPTSPVFEYGLSTAYGMTAAATPATVDGTQPAAVSAPIGNLLAGTTYHYRLVCESPGGITYGDDRTFSTVTNTVLAGLETSAGIPAPAWDVNRLDYAITVPHSTSQITLKPVGASAGAAVAVDGSPVAPGASSAAVALAVGNRSIPVEVTAADGVTTRTYTVTVTRLPDVLNLDGPGTTPVSANGFQAGGLDVTLALTHAPATGEGLTVVDNEGLEPIHGTFGNLLHGQPLTLDFEGVPYHFVADYHGGTGNDLVLRWANTALVGWGRNNAGQAGSNSGLDLYAPTPVEWGEVLGDRTPMAMAAGGGFSAVVLSDGRILTWGSNSSGQLGVGVTGNLALPVEVDRSGVLAGRTVVALAAGREHLLALCDDGTLAAWGDNQYGQLGDGSTEDRAAPVEVDRTGVLSNKRVVAIAAGRFHSLALCSDGTVATWGWNDAGQLGNGRYRNSSVPVAVAADGVLAGKVVVAMAAGYRHSLALCADNTLVSWGSDNHGALGNGSDGSVGLPVLVDRSGVLAGKTVTDLAAGDYFSVVRCADGSLASWGYNSNGRLAAGTESAHDAPLQVGGPGGLPGRTIDAISLGSAHGMAMTDDGVVLTWGEGDYGRLGHGGNWSRTFPGPIDLSRLSEGQRFVQLLSGSSAMHCLAIVASPPRPVVATLAAGDVGDEGATLRGTVRPLGGSAAAWFEFGVDASYGSVVAASPDAIAGPAEETVLATLSGLLPGVTYHYRVVASGPGGVAAGADEVFTVGAGAALAGLSTSAGVLEPAFEPGRLDYTTTVPATVNAVTLTPVAADPAAIVTVNGAAVASGAASQPVSLSDGESPITIAVTSADGAVTRHYRLAVTRLPATFRFDSPGDRPLVTGRLAAAGQDVAVELGFAPTTGTELTLVEVTGFQPIAGRFGNLAQGATVSLTFGAESYSFVVDYFGGSGNDLVLRWAGSRVYGWGRGSTPDSTLPVAIADALLGETIRLTGTGASHRFVGLADGTLVAWGANDSGQLGDGTTTDRAQPVPVDQSGVLSGKTVIAVSGGASHSLALCADGTVASWGSNSDGQLGTGTRQNSSVPVAVDTSGVLANRTVVAIAAGVNCSYALCADGTVAAWGDNQDGTLGDGTTTDRTTPVALDQSGVLAGKTVIAIAAGERHALVLCADGTLASWGYDGNDALGNAASESSSVPVRVDPTGVLLGRQPIAIAAGQDHSYALCADGRIASWGYGPSGQLGTGYYLISSEVPVLVEADGVLDGRTVVEVVAGGTHGLALCADGALVGWGGNYFGELGLGYTADRLEGPVLVDLSGLPAGEVVTSVFSSAHSRASYAVTAIPGIPSVGTLAATDVGDTAAVLGGEIVPDEIAGEVWFEFGTSPDYGEAVPATPAAIDGTTEVSPSVVLTGLVPGATYHYQLIFETAHGTFAGGDRTFTTTTGSLLTGLTADPGPLVPSFDPLNGLYAVTVPETAASIRLTATTAGPGATVTINGVSVPSGSPSPPIVLGSGINTVAVVVTSAGGEPRIYSVRVVRIPGEIVFDTPGVPAMTSDLFQAVGELPPVRLGHVPATGSRLTIVEHTGSSPILGTFDNLPQGAMVPLEFEDNTYHFLANYYGGDGNDLVLEWAGIRLVGWGSNRSAQLANGTTINSSLPYPAGLGGALAGKRVLNVATGREFTAAVAADGTVAAWGWNPYGLGAEDVNSSEVPIAVDQSGVLAGKTVVQLVANSAAILALCSDGTMAAWGYNGNGEFANGSETNSSFTPFRVDPGGVLSGKSVTAVAGGWYHSMALSADGAVYAWGGNSDGQLGDNSTSPRREPTPVDAGGVLNGRKVIDIAAATQFSLALCDDGTIVAWGNNDNGQLGDGTTTSSRVPVAVDQTGVLAGKTVVDIAAGGGWAGGHALALCSDGTVAAWGAGSGGRLGNGRETKSSVPVLVDQTGVLADKTVVAVKITTQSNFALCDDGTLAAWGANADGNLGDGSTAKRLRPVETALFTLFPGERLVDLTESSSAGHVIGRVTIPAPASTTLAATGITGLSATLHGSIHVNGSSSAAWFELGTTASYDTIIDATPELFNRRLATPVAAGVADLTPDTIYHYRLVVENEFGTIRGTDRSFRTLSDNAHLADLVVGGGVLGPDFSRDVTTYHVAVPFETANVAVTPVTEHFGAQAVVDGQPVASGSASTAIDLAVGTNAIPIVVTAEDGITTMAYTVTVTRLPQEFVFNSAADIPVSADGFSARGVSANLVLRYAPVPGTILTVVDNTSLGFIHGEFDGLAQGQRVSLHFDGKSYGFVADYFGGTGNDLVLQWADVVTLAWGANNYGQLGDGSTTRRLAPVEVIAEGILAGKTVTEVSTGYLHSLALCADGTVAAWGYNAYGQLGIGGSTARHLPVGVDQTGVLADRTVVAISAGPFHNLALCADGTVVSWGYNNHGQLGTGDRATRRVPIAVAPAGALAGKQVVAVAAGAYQSFALCADGTVAAWGYNDEGELGDGTVLGSMVPVAVDASGVLAGRRVVALSAGQYHTLALCDDGSVVSWGYNDQGQLGDHSAASSASPVAVDATGVLSGKVVTAVRASDAHSLAMCADGTLATWGANNRSQLGVDGVPQSMAPVAVPLDGGDLTRMAASVAVGRDHNLVRFADGGLSGWGDNASGQLGDNGTLTTAVPSPVDASVLDPGARFMFAASGSSSLHSVAVAGVPSGPPTGMAMWLQEFGGVAIGGDFGDPDHDGIPNLMEYAFGLNPMANSAGQLPAGRIINGNFVLNFTRPAGVSGIVYGAEWSTTMEPGSWKDIPDAGTGGMHIFSMPMTTAARLFIRLTVELR